MLIELGKAICLMLIIEGVLPFLYPNRWRKMVAVLAATNDNRLRVMGLMSMVIGVGLLFLIN